MAKFFVLGLDGATFRIIDPLIKAGKLPNLARLKLEGSAGILWSTIHPYSAQAWSSFMTGMNPGKHGLFDFIHHEENAYKLKFVNATHRKGDTIWRILGNYGLKVGVMNVPLTYPPEKVNGFLISGMDAPGKGSNFVYPPSLLKELETQVGPYTIELNIRDYFRHGLEEKFLDDLKQMIKQQIKFVKYLVTHKEWDFFIFVCRATDQVQHFYWRFMDPKHPYHPKSVSPKLKNAVADIYKEVDAAIGEIERLIGPETYLLIMSDHGQAPDGNKALYINKWLHSKGFLKFKKERAKGIVRVSQQERVAKVVDFLKKIIPRKVKDFLLDHFPELRDKIETAVLFSDIDFERTLAYSEDVRGNIWINLKGRQPQGQVKPEDYHKIREQLIHLLKELRDPETGQKIVDKVFKREELYSGEFVSKAPDIIFTQPIYGRYTYMLRRSRIDKDLDKYIETIPESQLGVWPTASHTLDGIFILKGNKINCNKWIESANIIDLAPTILYLMGIPIPDNMDGVVIKEAIDPNLLQERPPQKMYISKGKDKTGLKTSDYSKEEVKEIEERLKDLGYIE